MSNGLSLIIEGRYASIENLTWENIPSLAVLTGMNGSGKSQLLELIASYHELIDLPDSGEAVLPTVSFTGDRFLPGEVFHSYGEWRPLTSAIAYEDQVKDAIRDIQASRRSDQLINLLSTDLRISTQEIRNSTPTQFAKRITPHVLWNYASPKFQTLSFLFLAYRVLERDALASGSTPDEIRVRLGEPPWELMAAVIASAGLPFTLVPPRVLEPTKAMDTNEEFEVDLRDSEGNLVPFDRLSSGERVLMSTAMWRYQAESAGKYFRLLLLDEPDAHLHPSLTRRFLKVLKEVFVEQREVRVIMTTHSPSTVALTPDGHLFEMCRAHPRIRPVQRSQAIATLTDGFVAVQDGTRTVFLEGKDDPPFFRTVWQLLTERPTTSQPGMIDAYPNINFVHGQGRQTVQELIPQLRGAGFTNFFGLIDKDAGNIVSPGVYVLGRYAIENYLYDPLNVWFHLNKAGAAPAVNYPSSQNATRPRECGQDFLQAAIRAVVERIESQFPPRSELESRIVHVQYNHNVELTYPNWCLIRRKADIKTQFGRVFRQMPTRELLESYAEMNMVALELAQLYRVIQAA
jgi:predicted ATPase